MDERYFIVKNCLYALPYTALPQVRRFQLEVKLLKLRGKLLKQEGPPADLKHAIPFENLRLLVKELVTNSNHKDSYAEVSLLTELLEHAVENCMTTDAP